MAGEKVAPDTVSQFLGAAGTLVPAIFGGGKTTTKVTSDPGAISNLQNIINSANASADDENVTDAMVNNIMRNAAIQFAPTLGEEKQAGLYNSSTTQLLADQSKANASGAAAKAVLDFKTQQRGIAAQAAGSLAQATQTKTTQTGPSVDPTISGILGAAMTAKSLFANRNDIMKFIKDPVKTTKSWLDISDKPDQIPMESGLNADGGPALGGVGQDVVGSNSGVFDPVTRASIGADPATVSPADYISPTTAGSITSADLSAPISGIDIGTTGQQAAASIDAGASAAGLTAAQGGSSESLQPLQGSIPLNTGNFSTLGNPANDAPLSATSAATADDVANVTDAASSIDNASDLTQVADTASSIDDAADLTTGAEDVGSAIEAGSDVADAAEAADTGIEAASAASSATPYGLILTALSAVSQAFGGPSAGEAFSAVNSGFEQFNKVHAPEVFDVQQSGDEALSSLFQGDIGGVADSQVNMVTNEISDIPDQLSANVSDIFDPGSAIDDVGSALDTAGASSVICTEAQKQGLLDVNLARWEMQRNLLRLSKLTLRGYQFLAVPFVHKMRKDRRWAVFLARQANAYCNEICFKSGGFVGKFLRFVGEPICWIVGVGLLLSGLLDDVAEMVEKELYRHG